MSKLISRSWLLAVSVLCAAFTANVDADTVSISTTDTANWSAWYADDPGYVDKQNWYNHGWADVEGHHDVWNNALFSILKPLDGLHVGTAAGNDDTRPGGANTLGVRSERGDKYSYNGWGIYAFEYSLAGILPTDAETLSFSGWVTALGSADTNPGGGDLAAIVLRGSDGSLTDLWVSNGTLNGWQEFAFDAVSLLSGVNYALTFLVDHDFGTPSITLHNAFVTYTAPAGSGDGDGGNVAPEPATLALFGLGLGGLALARRRKK